MNASYPAVLPNAQEPHSDSCPSCGYRGEDWSAWSNRQSRPFRRRIHHGENRQLEVSGQKAKVVVMLSLAGREGITKRQLSGWHLGHWVSELRFDGLAITTEMVKRTYPKGSNAYAVYRLEEPVSFDDISHLPVTRKKRGPDKTKPVTGQVDGLQNSIALTGTNKTSGGFE